MTFIAFAMAEDVIVFIFRAAAAISRPPAAAIFRQLREIYATYVHIINPLR